MTSKSLQITDLESAGWKAREVAGFMGLAGPLWTRRDPQLAGSWQYGLLTDDRHTNPIELVHGGVLTTLMDHAVSLVAWSESGRQPCVTVELSTHFVESAKPGDFLVASASLTHKTRSILFLRGLISVQSRPVLQAQAIMKLVKS